MVVIVVVVVAVVVVIWEKKRRKNDKEKRDIQLRSFQRRSVMTYLIGSIKTKRKDGSEI